MQYIEVAVNNKTGPRDNTFTYKIPPEFLPYIKIGILVKVPFGSRSKRAIVTSIKIRSSHQKEKLKTLKSIISSSPIIDKTRMDLGCWLSRHYWTSLGQAIFTIIPPVAIRLAKGSSFIIPPQTALPSLSFNPSIYTFNGRVEHRWEKYIENIKKEISRDKRAIILFPDIKRARHFNEYAKKKLTDRNKIVFYHYEQNKTKHYKIWTEILQDKYDLAVGTRSAIFVPMSNLGAIIIDNCNDRFSYKEEQSPYYDVMTVAKALAQFTNAKIVLGDLVLSVDNYYHLISSHYLQLNKESNYMIADNKRTNIEIIDIGKHSTKSIISYELEQNIRKALQGKNKVVLFLNHKGEEKIWFCRGCQEIIRQERSRIPAQCSNCQSANLKEIGIDIPKVKTELGKIFPKLKIMVLQKKESSHYQLPVASYLIYDILLTTSAIFYHPQLFKNIGLVGVISIDHQLNLPNFRASENTFLLLNKLASIAPKMIIQTNFPENPVIQAIASGNYRKFYDAELKSRSRFEYPPFTQLIKIIFKNKTRGKQDLENSISSLKLFARNRTVKYQTFEKDELLGLLLKLKGISSDYLFKRIINRNEKSNMRDMKIIVDPIE